MKLASANRKRLLYLREWLLRYPMPSGQPASSIWPGLAALLVTVGIPSAAVALFSVPAAAGLFFVCLATFGLFGLLGIPVGSLPER